MPELPEVEAARRAIAEICAGKKIARAVVADDPKVIDGVSRSDFEAALVGKTLIAAHRKGKNLWLQLDSPPFPSFQFGMAGAVYIKGVAVTQYKRSAVNDNDDWPSKYSKLLIELDGGLEMSFTDKRRFAKVRLLKDPTTVSPISELGPDALLNPMTVDEFHEAVSKKKIAIKALLLDQSFISGIGNWIADEVLYQARIHPSQVASSLSRESCENLTKCIKKVIETAVEVGADSSRYPSNWVFHSREKKPGEAFVDGLALDLCNTTCMLADSSPSLTCVPITLEQAINVCAYVCYSFVMELMARYYLFVVAGKKINFITVGGRTTAYVPELQKLDGKEVTKAVDGKQKTRNLKAKGGQGEEQDEDVEESAPVDPVSKEEEITNMPTKKRELKPRGRGKRPLPKRKSKTDEEDNINNDDDEVDNGEDDNRDKSGRRVAGRKVRPKIVTEKVTSQIAGKLKKTVK